VGEIKSTRRLEFVHSDVVGPTKTESLEVIIDDYSRCVTVYPMKYKSEVLENFKELEAAVTNQAECKIKTLRTDNGGEYTSTEF
jgi:transposase InsO family protein